MSETKFTKGEWRADIRKNKTNINIMSNQNIEIAKVRPRYTLEETVGNAKLIAAAPDMLEVLETIENDNNQVPEWLWKRIKAVIQKAKV